MTITTIGLDTSKTWFQVHCVDADGRTVLRRKLARSKVLSFFANISSTLSASKLAADLISGRVSWRSSVVTPD